MLHYSKLYLIVFSTIWYLLLGCSMIAKPDETLSKEFVGWGFSIRLPQNIIVEKKSPADFDIYSFKKQGMVAPILKAYVGNHPNFPTNPSGNFIFKQINVNGLPAKDTNWVDSNNLFGRELLISLSQAIKDPSYIHYWYHENGQFDKLLADEIIATTKKN